MTYRQRESGQALILVVLGITVLIGALGLGIDMGVYRFQKRMMQTAADAAALAGANALPTVANVQAAAALGLTNNGFGASSGATSVVNSPPTCTTAAPCNLPAPDPNNGNNHYVEVVLTQNQPTYFSKIFGVTSVPLSVRAEAESNQNCIYTLGPSGADIVLLAAFVTTTCGVVDESSTKNGALTCLLGWLSAPSTEMVGTPASLGCFESATPRTGITLPTTPYDPMKYLQSIEPSTTPCGTTTASPYTGSTSQLTISSANSSAGNRAILNPGIYCGGINFASGAYATFTGGTYVITGAPGGMTIGPNTNINGSAGVTFYLNKGSVQFTFTSATAGIITLTAPSTGTAAVGTYPGILFFQPPSNTSAMTVFGTWSGNTHLTGGYYLPTASLTYALSFETAGAGKYAPMVVNNLSFFVSGFTAVGIFYEPPSGINPIASENAILVE